MRKCIIKNCKKFIAILSLAALMASFFSVSTTFAATKEDELDTEDVSIADIGDDESRYNSYLQQIEAAAAKQGLTVKNYSGPDIVLSPSKATYVDEDSNVVSPELITEEGKAGVIAWVEGIDELTWTVDIPESGYYQISVEYISKAESLGINPARVLSINGKVPFYEAQNIVFKKWWVDESEPERNPNTFDDVASDLIEVRKWKTVALRDTDGYYTEAFRIYFEKGENTISLSYAARDMFIGDIILSKPSEYKSYAEYSALYSNYDVSGSDIVTQFQAESYQNIVEKSSNMMRITSSKDTSVTPFRSGYTDMNQVGGSSNWYSDRDSYEWKFTVPESGLYKLALRVSNNFNIGMPVYRQIYIDGKIPFEEFEAYKFKFEYNYYTETLSDSEGNPYLIYLEEGEHTIKMEVVLGDLGALALAFYSETINLNKQVRAIKKIIGDNPDPNYNYRLNERVPGLMESLKNLMVEYDSMISILMKACETDSSTMINELRQAIDTLQYCVDNPIDIPSRLSDITSIQTNMGSWISTVESSALNLDYIEICEPAATPSNPKASFWMGLKNLWDSFIVSFTKNYNAVYEQANVSGDVEVVEIWMSKDRENADMIIPLINEQFTADKGFICQVRIVPGQIEFGGFNLLLLSLMSGQEPDMIWGCSSSTPVQYAIRGIGYDISQFDDYDEVMERFADATIQSISYRDNTEERNGVYGMPVTTSLSFMVYRTDVFEELGISVPNTYEEYYDILLPTFYKEGLIAPNLLGNLLIQKGGWSTRSDNRLSGYDTPLAYDVQVEQWDVHLVHGVDLNIQEFQGFRDGDYPLMGGSLDSFVTLDVQAPELMGKWDVAMPIGYVDEYGIVNRAQSGVGASEVLALMPDSDHKEECWEVMKWWTSTDIQVKFTNMVDAKFGGKNRHYSANIEALLSMGWSLKVQTMIREIIQWCVNSQAILGDYQMNRYASFASNQVLLQGRNARDAIEEMIEMTNPEVWRKQAQYDIIPPTQEEIDDMTYDISVFTLCSYYRELREEAQKKLDEQRKGE